MPSNGKGFQVGSNPATQPEVAHVRVSSSSVYGEKSVSETMIPFKLNEAGWWGSIPACAGWYRILTDTPIDRLRSLPPPKGAKHYNIPDRIAFAAGAIELHMVIEQARSGELYTIYSGEHPSLKRRAREHYSGHQATACLALGQYAEHLGNEFKWEFAYNTFEAGMSNSGCTASDDKLLRIIIEQQWRAQKGWPVLCLN